MRRLLSIALLFVAVGLCLCQSASNIPNTISIQASGVPSGSCGNNFVYTDSSTGNFYNCKAGAWNQVNSGGSGTITGVTAGTGLSGGGTSGTVTVNIANTAVTPGSYTNANFTVNAQGQLMAASNGTSAVIGPGFAGVVCANGATGSGTTLSCATTATAGFNVVANQNYYMFCSLFISGGGGTDTLTASDTLSLTWTSIANVWFSGRTERLAVFSANSGSSTGADTFTCNDATAFTFSEVAVVASTGGTGTDGTANATTASSANLSAPLTTTVANDLLFAWERGGVGTPTLNGSLVSVVSNSNIAASLSYQRTNATGPYPLSMNTPGGASVVTVALK